MPLLGPSADDTQRALNVLERRFHRITRALAPRQPVLQHKRSDADGVEPLRDIVAFLIDGQMFVATSRAEDDANASIFLLEGQVNSYVGHADKGDAAIDDAVLTALSPSFLDFGGRSRFGGIGPEVDGQRLGEKRREESEAQNEMRTARSSNHALTV